MEKTSRFKRVYVLVLCRFCLSDEVTDHKGVNRGALSVGGDLMVS